MLMCWKGKQSKLTVCRRHTGEFSGFLHFQGSSACAESTSLGNYLWVKTMQSSLSMDVTYTVPSELASCRWLQLVQEKSSRQDMKPPGSACASHLVSTAVKSTWAKSRSGTTCSHPAWAVFNYPGTGITAHNDLIQGRRKKAEWEQHCKARGEECWVRTGLFSSTPTFLQECVTFYTLQYCWTAQKWFRKILAAHFFSF